MVSTPTSVLICDADPAVREGLRRAVASMPGIGSVATVRTAEDVLTRYPRERQDVVLMAARLPGLGGVEATQRLMRAHPAARVVLLVDAGQHDQAAQAVTVGARGWLSRDASTVDVAAMLSTASASPIGSDLPDLTERELQVLRGMADGKSNAEIGRELFVSEDTVKTHARRLFRKLGARDRAHAVAAGFRAGLVA
jgi:DNA-binding NarL/FixJ family response regulator